MVKETAERILRLTAGPELNFTDLKREMHKVDEIRAMAQAYLDLEELKQAARDALRLTDVVYPPHERLIALLDRLDK